MPFGPALFRLLPQRLGAPQLPPGAAEAAGELAAGGQAQTFAAWLTSLLPSNPIAAAASGAMMPLILFTLLFALAIARSPAPTRTTLTRFFQALGDAMLTLVRWVVMLAPIGVFALVLPLAAHAGAALAGAIGFYIVAYSVGCLRRHAAALSRRRRSSAGIPMRRFAPRRACRRSSSPSAPAPRSPRCRRSSKARSAARAVADDATGFVLPLAVSTFKIAAPLSWTVGALFVGWFYGIPLHAGGLATIAFAAIFLAFAVPGIPRGAFIMLTPLFLAIGLPAEGIGLLIAVDAIPDTFSTVLNVTGDLAAAALVARGESAITPPPVEKLRLRIFPREPRWRKECL